MLKVSVKEYSGLGFRIIQGLESRLCWVWIQEYLLFGFGSIPGLDLGMFRV